MNELTSGEQPVVSAESSESVRLAEAAARAAEAEARKVEALAAIEEQKSNQTESRWGYGMWIGFALIIAIAVTVSALTKAGVFS